jgi:hypothetical protein
MSKKFQKILAKVSNSAMYTGEHMSKIAQFRDLLTYSTSPQEPVP